MKEKLKGSGKKFGIAVAFEFYKPQIIGIIRRYSNSLTTIIPYIQENKPLPFLQMIAPYISQYSEQLSVIDDTRVFELFMEARPDLASEIMAADEARWFCLNARLLRAYGAGTPVEPIMALFSSQPEQQLVKKVICPKCQKDFVIEKDSTAKFCPFCGYAPEKERDENKDRDTEEKP